MPAESKYAVFPAAVNAYRCNFQDHRDLHESVQNLMILLAIGQRRAGGMHDEGYEYI